MLPNGVHIMFYRKVTRGGQVRGGCLSARPAFLSIRILPEVLKRSWHGWHVSMTSVASVVGGWGAGGGVAAVPPASATSENFQDKTRVTRHCSDMTEGMWQRMWVCVCVWGGRGGVRCVSILLKTSICRVFVAPKLLCLLMWCLCEEIKSPWDFLLLKVLGVEVDEHRLN